MAYLGDIIRTLKNGMVSMNEGVNAVDRIQKAVPQSMLSEYAPNVHWNDEFPPEYNDGVSGMTWAQVMVNQTRESMRSGDGKLDDKFAPGFFRILLTECGFLDDHRNDEQEEKQRRLEGLYKLFIEDHDADKTLMSYNFVPMVQTKSGPKAKDGTKAWICEDFENRYGKTLDDKLDDDKRKASEAVLADHGYKVIEIKNFKMANEYGEFTGGEGGRSKLCYTQGESTMRSQFGGLERNRVWLAYKPDFKKIEPVVGEDNPYDKYGLSMIWVFVAPDGSMPYVNVRWNHENSGAYDRGGKSTDHCLSMADVVEITGYDFKTTFLPYKVEEKYEIDRGLGNGFSVVVKKILMSGNPVGEECNICHDGDVKNTVLPEWVDRIYSQEDGFVKIEKDMKQNLFDLNTKEFVLPEWTECVEYLKDGFVRFVKGEKENLFDLKTNKFVLSEWVGWIDAPEDGFVKIEKDRKHNLFNLKMKELVLPEWVDWIYGLKNGFVEVDRDGKHNLVDLKKNEFLLPEWVDYIEDPKNGLVKISKDGGHNLFDLETKKLVFPEWVDYIEEPEDGFVEVGSPGKWNLLDLKTKELVFSEWFNGVGYSGDGLVKISKHGKDNLFDLEKNEFVFPEWFDGVRYSGDGFVGIKKDGKWNLLDMKKNEFVLPEWVDWIDCSKDGFVGVGKDGKRQNIKLSDLRKTESRRRRENRICECCGRRIR